ncbi:hypothetical protein [Hyphomicrobium sp. LHD-15]|uniref:hypothetical protein n=1 Tax=Hyphomicrobium sp. LHD-15 TaxID=3072142 RepID=UPI00281063B8|nr:hypothetical protein [Hyphomicrobium sp. LHD-15]MDQ8699679.1 hypothetical protein [Hyphomicrobium sp. LHD-15]
MQKFLSIATAIVTLLIAGAPSASAEPETPILTIAGEISHPNRGALDPFRDAFLSHKDKTFTKAFVFTRSSLASLPQTKISTNVEGWPGKIELEGPRLLDALAAAGVAADATIVATALDGYNIELTPEARTAHDWILAIGADGAPLSIGGRGPAWLIHGTDGKAVSQEVEATWVWALYLLEVK